MRLPRHRTKTADLPEQPLIDLDAVDARPWDRTCRSCGRDIVRMAPDSNTAIGLPPGPSGSTMAGMRLCWARPTENAAWNCSPRLMLTGLTTIGSRHSSSMMLILMPFEVGQK